MTFLFRSCIFGSRPNGRRRVEERDDEQADQTINSRRRRRPYVTIPREKSPLLTSCWAQDWDAVCELCQSHPEYAFHKSHNSDRTALHLAVMPGARAPTTVLRRLIQANPYAVLESDRHKFGGTPLHFACGSCHRDDPDMIRLFVETLVRVQKEDDGARTLYQGMNHFYSPLYLLAKFGASPQSLQALIDQRQNHAWIAPWTGAETELHTPKQASNQPLQSAFAVWQEHCESETDLDMNTMRQFGDRMWHPQYENDSSDPPSSHRWWTPNETDLSGMPSYMKDWANLVLLLRPLCQGKSDSLLHTAARMYRPVPGLLRLVAAVYPEHHLRRNDDGDIPLHVAIASPIYRFSRLPSQEHPIHVLLEGCPESLTISATASVDIDLGDVSQDQRVKSYSLLPAFFAASRNASLDTIFELLHTVPSAVEMQRQQPQ